jgi:hypothetical protein
MELQFYQYSVDPTGKKMSTADISVSHEIFYLHGYMAIEAMLKRLP